MGLDAGRSGRLMSSRFVPTKGCKVRFYYYMNSASSAGELNFMTRNQSSGPTTYLWSTSKVVGHHWERQEVSIAEGTLSELLIEVRSLGGGGYIAIDDISFSPQCNNSNGYLPYGTTVPSMSTTRAPCTYSCRDGTCVGKDKVKKRFFIKLKGEYMNEINIF